MRAFRLSSQTLSRMLLKCGSALTSAHSAEPSGKSISSSVLPKSMLLPRERANFETPLGRTCIMDTCREKEPPTGEQARKADQRKDAEFDLVLIGMAWDSRIG